MLWHPFVLFSILLIAAGSIMSLLSSFWLGVWLGLELNMMAFIPFLSMDKESSSEASMKYFLIQAAASFVLLFSGAYLSMFPMLKNLILLSLSTKMGSAPVYFWFPLIAEMISVKSNLVLMTIQKLVPLTLMFYFISLDTNVTLFGLMLASSAVIGSAGGLNEISLRKLLSFSSINHMAWMFLGMLLGFSLWFFYFLIYCFLTIMVFYTLKKFQILYMNFLNLNLDSVTKLIISMNLLSLGGLPPLLGFFPKFLLMGACSNLHMYIYLIILLISSTITLYYYTRMSLNMFISKIFSSSLNSNISSKFYLLVFSVSVNLFSLPMLLMVN